MGTLHSRRGQVVTMKKWVEGFVFSASGRNGSLWRQKAVPGRSGPGPLDKNATPAPMMKKLPISVCMISAAEARRIARALESVAGWAGEIIVVLNEDVRDGTDEIAARYGAKVF